MTTAQGGGGGSSLFAITPEGERIEPDADGVLHCTLDDTVIGLCGGGGGRAQDRPVPPAVGG